MKNHLNTNLKNGNLQQLLAFEADSCILYYIENNLYQDTNIILLWEINNNSNCQPKDIHAYQKYKL